MMNIKNFKFPLDIFQAAKQQDDIYLGLFLKEKDGVILFIQNKGNKLEILAKEAFSYTNSWDNIVEDVDDALYKLETHTKKSPEKTIYFIYSHLIDDSTREIQRSILHKIKELSKNLELKPLGYIECHEGISSYLEKKDGVPTTSTLIELDSTTLSVFVYKGGKVIFKETAKRGQEIVDDLIPIFEKVKHIAMIPSRIVLYDSKKVGIEAEKILSYRWNSELFMQLPKVEVVTEQELLESLISVFSAQVLLPVERQKIPSEEKEDTFGFVIGGDVPAKDVREEQESHEQVVTQPLVEKTNPLSNAVSAVKAFISTLGVRLKSYSLKMKGVPIPVLALVGAGLIVLAVFLIEFYFHKAELTVFFPGKAVDKSLTINASTKADTSALKLAEATTNTELNNSKSTTGKKEIGEKAKGSVTVYNSSLTEGKSFSKGTTITAPNSTAFLLNSDVKVASASGDATAITPSTAKVDVAAVEIGQEGNVASGTKFSIEGESAVVIAKNDSAFTGGVKRTVQTVAKQDIDTLRAQALKKAQEYSDKEVQKSLKGGVKVLSNLSDVNLQDPQFSHDAGEEAGQVSIKSKADITYYTYKDDDLLKMMQSRLKGDVEKGYDLPKNTIKYSVGKISSKSGEFQIAFDVKAKQVKSLKEEDVEKVLAGKSEDDLEKILKEKFGASGLEFRIHSPVLLLHNRLPFFRNNINFKVSYL